MGLGAGAGGDYLSGFAKNQPDANKIETIAPAHADQYNFGSPLPGRYIRRNRCSVISGGQLNRAATWQVPAPAEV